MKKFYPEKNVSNIYIEVSFTGKQDREYICTGVLIREMPESIRVAFNATEDHVTDYLDIPNSKITSIRRVKVMQSNVK